MTEELKAQVARLKVLMAVISPEGWTNGECSNGGLLLQRPPFEGQRFAIQSHVQILPHQDAEFIVLARNSIAGLLGEVERLEKVGNEILRIMATYHEQEDWGGVDTPGGLEHISDVWRLLGKWEKLLSGSEEVK